MNIENQYTTEFEMDKKLLSL